MKKYILFSFVLCVIAFGGISVSAQCNTNSLNTIECGFYNSGYTHGADDARSNRSNDYKRYRNKYRGGQYENVFRDGYRAGYDSQGSSTRWTYSQRSAYDSGYNIGQNDRRRPGQSSARENSSRGYDNQIGLYFQQGYNDGFNNVRRRYDFAVDNNPIDPPYPGNGGGSGASWSGRVDDRIFLTLRGNSLVVQTISGKNPTTYSQNVNGSLPRRDSTVTVKKIEGRGNVTVIQQPNRSNSYATTVQIDDPRGGADNYKIEIDWNGSSSGNDQYSPGSVYWRGRVDQTVDVIISGSDVRTENVSGSGVSNVDFRISGYLASRPGSVRVNKRDGRGSATVIQQPSRNNNYTAIVRIFDPSGGADNYQLDISW